MISSPEAVQFQANTLGTVLIALELRQQYTVGFYSKATDNNWNRVKVRVTKTSNGSDLTLTYREGYQIAAGGY